MDGSSCQGQRPALEAVHTPTPSTALCTGLAPCPAGPPNYSHHSVYMASASSEASGPHTPLKSCDPGTLMTGASVGRGCPSHRPPVWVQHPGKWPLTSSTSECGPALAAPHPTSAPPAPSYVPFWSNLRSCSLSARHQPAGALCPRRGHQVHTKGLPLPCPRVVHSTAGGQGAGLRWHLKQLESPSRVGAASRG